MQKQENTLIVVHKSVYLVKIAIVEADRDT